MIHCHICGQKTEYFLEKDDFSFQKCTSCGLVFVHPQPQEKHLHEEVYSKKAGYQKHKKKDLNLLRESSHIKKILDFLETVSFPREVRIVSAPGPRLLDVGCSSGEFLFFAKKRGFETYGVELNPLTAEIAQANGLRVRQGTLKDVHFEDNFFDVVFLGDIIEHVPSPRELLLECRRILKKGGMLVVSTPNLDCFWARRTFTLWEWFSVPWSVLTPPHHLFQFQEDNLKMLLKELGFHNFVVWYRRPPTLKYELGSLHLLGKWKREKTFKNLFFMFFSFGVYAKVYLVDMLVTPLKKKDCGMIVVSQKI